MILCNNLSKEYDGIPAVNRANIKINKGELVALLGNNGAGKTTLLNMLAGIVKPSSGSIHFDSANLPGPEIPTNRARIGIVSEHSFLTPELTIKENLSFYGSLFYRSRGQYDIASVMDEYGLTTRQNQKVGTLSRGWKQRTSIARAMLGEPEYMLLDEPENGIDQTTRGILGKSLFSKTASRSLIFATHNIDLAIDWCSKAIILENGNLIHEIDDLSNESKPKIMQALDSK
ncbi:MAG: ABC transporter ATP-binding protein [Chloroflexota bacterium]|nr:ABC transporter ATP-binding protein [Chloroflexota bacterium]